MTLLLPLIILAVTLRYNEDIMDFLPVTAEEREALNEYQAQQSAMRMVLIVEGGDEEQRAEVIDECAERIPGLETEIDLDEQMRLFYSLMPYLIEDSTYTQLDSLFSPEAIQAALQRDKAILSTPGAGLFSTAIQSDPLGLVNISHHPSPITPNRSYAFYTSPYGSTETKRNAALVDSLNAAIQSITRNPSPVTHHPSPLTYNPSPLSLRWIGAPVIAVGNARRIKTDTLLCIALSLVLIIALLAYAFPRKRDLWLILLAISFGWLTGMAVLRIVTPAVSAVVLGIGSVLIGIAVNYPLHLLVHQRYTTSVRQTLDEVLSPLVVGNITTVGAFLALVPLHAIALRHLGLFAASMLIGTILFCIFVMPHLMSAEPTPIREIHLPLSTFHSPLSTFHFPLSTLRSPLSIALLVLTIGFGAYLALSALHITPSTPLFDSNLNHINYMTPQQRADMAYFDSVANPLNVIANNSYKLERWQEYWQTHSADTVIARIQTEATQAGFKPEAFEPFYDQITHNPSSVTHNPSPITHTPLSFSDITRRLSDDFDYIGLCCSLIVFIFLWLSFRNLWLALIAFVPMALSWVWILAIMQLFGLQFNIVNIILATFIFGQGDDYTIFIVEGLLYEHRTGKPMLPQYRQSILLSAAIMLIGIGILVLAVHPAMHSLGAITLIGMTIVLLMANTIPPLLFRLYTKLSPR